MTELPATIASLAAFVAAIGAIWTARSNSRRADRAALSAEAARATAEESKREIIATRDGVFEVGKQLDGRLSELLRVSIAAARAEGVAEGQQQQGETP